MSKILHFDPKHTDLHYPNKIFRFGLVFSNGKLHLLKRSYHFNATSSVKNRNSFKVVMSTNGLTIRPYYKSNSFNNLFSNSSKVWLKIFKQTLWFFLGYFTNSTMLNFNFQQSHALGQLHQTLTSSNITRGTPQAGLVQLYKDQNNIIHTLIIVYAKNNKFMGLLPNNPSGKWAFHFKGTTWCL